MSKKNTGKAPALPLTRWRYFCKTLYSNAAAKGEFSYEGVTYLKDEELRAIEEKSTRVHVLLVLVLIVIYLTMRAQSIYMVVAGMAAIVAGEVYREQLLPKDILSHLQRPSYQKRRQDVVDDLPEEEDA